MGPFRESRAGAPWSEVTYFSLETLAELPPVGCACESLSDEEHSLPLDVEENLLEEIPADERQHLQQQLQQALLPDGFGNDVIDVDPEGTADANLGVVSNANLKGNAGKHWFIHVGRPPHVHTLVWRQLAESTLKRQIFWLQAIKAMPEDLQRAPFGPALLSLVLRLSSRRGWKWSTISSALSTVASALSSLPLYSNVVRAIDIRQDAHFAAALKRSQHLARIRTVRDPPVMTLLQFQHLQRNMKDARARLLLQLCWFMAGRVGDVRQLLPPDVQLSQLDDKNHMVATFRAGKGSVFWGPYSIHCTLTAPCAKDMAYLLAHTPSATSLFTQRDQRCLSEAVKKVDLELRSIRRGSLMHLAQHGIGDSYLQLLSGHKRLDTLHRYLGWGTHSSTAIKAASRRDDAATKGAGRTFVEPPRMDIHSDVGNHELPYISFTERTEGAGVEPPKMGLHSGFSGMEGRRIARPPPFFPAKAPSRAELGVQQVIDTRSWPLHIKPVSNIHWNSLRDMVARQTGSAHLHERLLLAERFCSDTKLYDATGLARTFTTKELPYSSFCESHLRTLIQCGKIVAFSGVIRGYVKGFVVPQYDKKRLRPVFEPSLNDAVKQAVPNVAYPSRLERRAETRAKRWATQFDFAAYFDQFPLGMEARSFFILRTRIPIDGCSTFALTRLPMGACFAPFVAQAVTDVLVYTVLKKHGTTGVSASSMIDNVRFTSASTASLRGATEYFEQLVRRCTLTLNECEGQTTDYIFLGERYISHVDSTTTMVANTDKNLSKLTAALERLNGGPEEVTRRQFASLMGLMLFLAHTVNEVLSHHNHLIRAYSKIAQLSSGWDEKLPFLSSSVLQAINNLGNRLLQNIPVACPIIVPPGSEPYIWSICIDASKIGWGAIIRNPTGNVERVSQLWPDTIAHSAHAEPRAVMICLRWLKRHRQISGRVAIMTDHAAIAYGQRRWWSAFGGFSRATALNGAFEEMYSDPELQVEILHIPGDLNPADTLSRNPEGYEIRCKADDDFVFPSTAVHPYQTRAVSGKSVREHRIPCHEQNTSRRAGFGAFLASPQI